MITKHFSRPACLKSVLGLLFMLLTVPSFSAPKHKLKKKGVENTMTVAAIRPPVSSETFVRVTFLQSQRFYKLPNDANPNYLALLKESEKSHTPVVIKRAKEESDVILSVRKP